MQKRNHVNIFRRHRHDFFCRLSTIHERNRQADHESVTSTAIGKIACERCRMSPKIVGACPSGGTDKKKALVYEAFFYDVESNIDSEKLSARLTMTSISTRKPS